MLRCLDAQNMCIFMVRKRKPGCRAVMKSNAAVEPCLTRATSAMLDMFPRHVDSIDAARRKIPGEINVLRSHSAAYVQKCAFPIEPEQCTHPVHKVLGRFRIV